MNTSPVDRPKLLRVVFAIMFMCLYMKKREKKNLTGFIVFGWFCGENLVLLGGANVFREE